MGQPDQFNRIFAPGNFWGVLGLMRTGKTTLLMMIAQAAIAHGWVVFSNVKLHQWVPEKKRFSSKKANIPNYHFVKTWAEMWALLPKYVGMVWDEETKTQRMKTRIMLCVDEAMLTDLGGGRTIQSSKPRSAVAMAVQAAKLGISICIVAHTKGMLTSQMRVGGTLVGYMRKIAKAPYSAVETVRFEVPDRDVVNFDPDNLSHYRMYYLKVEPTGIARPKEMIATPEGYDPDEVIYISETPASVVTGTYPGTAQPFDMDHMLEMLSEVDPEDTAAAIAQELQHPPKRGIVKAKPRGDDEEEEEHETSGEEKTGEVKVQIESLLKSGLSAAEVIERVGKERRSQVYKYQREMRAAGEI